jgi:hypothetical protein
MSAIPEGPIKTAIAFADKIPVNRRIRIPKLFRIPILKTV